jgi:transcription initiation factor IIE alpha subunit
MHLEGCGRTQNYKLFDYIFRYYVDEKDELIPKRLSDNRISEERQKWRERLEVKQVRDREGKSCPECNSRVKYDALQEEYACAKCGWRGLDPIIVES